MRRVRTESVTAGVADPASLSGEKASMHVTGPMQVLTTPRAVRRYAAGGYTQITDDVLKEWTLRIHVDSVLVAELICTPDSLEELVLGFLYSSGVIASAEDVESIALSESGAQVTMRASSNGRTLVAEYGADRMMVAGHEAGRMMVAGHEAGSAMVAGHAAGSAMVAGHAAGGVDRGDYVGVATGQADVRGQVVLQKSQWDPQTVLANATMVLNRSRLFKKTGNVHSVAICRGPELLYFHEDVGRFNAFDKCVGHALKDTVDLSDTCVYTTGRVPSSFVTKIIRAGIPMIVSRSAPTQAALALADQSGLTVVGFARGDRFTLYLPTQ